LVSRPHPQTSPLVVDTACHRDTFFPNNFSASSITVKSFQTLVPNRVHCPSGWARSVRFDRIFTISSFASIFLVTSSTGLTASDFSPPFPFQKSPPVFPHLDPLLRNLLPCHSFLLIVGAARFSSSLLRGIRCVDLDRTRITSPSRPDSSPPNVEHTIFALRFSPSSPNTYPQHPTTFTCQAEPKKNDRQRGADIRH